VRGVKLRRMEEGRERGGREGGRQRDWEKSHYHSVRRKSRYDRLTLQVST
jgi:hypothetical protein